MSTTTYIVLPPPGSAWWRDGVATSADLPSNGGSVVGECRIAEDTGAIWYWTGAVWASISVPGAVPVTRTISTTAPLTGGGDLSANRTLGITQSGVATDGYLSTADWNTFNNKVAATRSILTTAPLTGGGNLSADRTLSMPAATTVVDGYLTSGNFTTFNNKVSGTRAINTTSPLTGGGDLSADRTFAIPVATSGANGYLSSTDWSTFNNKEPAIAAATTADYYRGDKTFQQLNIAALTATTGGAAAGAGVIGQILTASQLTNTTTNVGATGAWGAVVSLSITAGRWLVWGSVGFNENGAVLTTSFAAGISASATGAGIDEFATTVSAYQISGAADALMTTPHTPVNISGTTTYYLNSQFFYTSGTPRHRGKISALRIG